MSVSLRFLCSKARLYFESATLGMLVVTRCSATRILCVRSRVHKIFCTEKGRFEGYFDDILFISSLFKNALNLLLKCDLIYYSSVCMDDQVLAP